MSKSILEEIRANTKEYSQDYKQLHDEVSQSKAIYKGEPVPFLYIPKFFSKEDLLVFDSIVKQIFHLVNKTIDLYLSNESVRKMYNFDPRLQELILLKPLYDTHVPMGRFDLFYYNPQEYKFCELNTDGSSAMNEDKILGNIIGDSKLVQKLESNYEINQFELFETWVKEVKNIIKADHQLPENATVCILDFIHDKPSDEFIEFKNTFERSGFNCMISDPRDLEYRDGYLYDQGVKIDIIYRRLVTKDLMDHYEDVSELIEGIQANNTFIIGSLRSQIVHTKKFFKVLHDPEFQELLTQEEIDFITKHIPYTEALTVIKDEFVNHQHKYILKPVDSYASKGVISGRDLSFDEWQVALKESLDRHYLIQEYYEPPTHKNVIFDSQDSVTVHDFNDITGLFVYNESLYGIYSRAGLHSIVSGLHEGYTIPSYLIKEK